MERLAYWLEVDALIAALPHDARTVAVDRTIAEGRPTLSSYIANQVAKGIRAAAREAGDEIGTLWDGRRLWIAAKSMTGREVREFSKAAKGRKASWQGLVDLAARVIVASWRVPGINVPRVGRTAGVHQTLLAAAWRRIKGESVGSAPRGFL